MYVFSQARVYQKVKVVWYLFQPDIFLKGNPNETDQQLQLRKPEEKTIYFQHSYISQHLCLRLRYLLKCRLIYGGLSKNQRFKICLQLLCCMFAGCNLFLWIESILKRKITQSSPHFLNRLNSFPTQRWGISRNVIFK